MVSAHFLARHRLFRRLCAGAFIGISLIPTPALPQAAPQLSPPGFYDPAVGLSVGSIMGNGLAGRGVPVNDNVNSALELGKAAQTALDLSGIAFGNRGKTWAGLLGLAAAGTAIAGAAWCWTTSYCWKQTPDGKIHPVQNANQNSPTGAYPPMDGKTGGYKHVEQGVTCFSTTLRGVAECSVVPLNSYRAKQSTCAGTVANNTCAPYTACSVGNDSADYCANGVRQNTFSTTAVAAADMPAQCQNGVASVAVGGAVSCGIPPATPMPGSPGADKAWDDLSVGQALDSPDTTIPENVQASPLSAKQLGDMTNYLWAQAAAQPGYTGVPYKPFTQAEIEAAYAQGLQQGLKRPTVEELFSAPTPGQAQNAVGSQTSPGPATGVLQGADLANSYNYASPGTAIPTTGAPALGSSNYAPTTSTAAGPVTVNVTVNPVVSPKLDLGPDPNIGKPTLEEPPGWQRWYERIKTALPFVDPAPIKSFQASGSYACPTDKATVFGKEYVLDQHCALLDGYKGRIQNVFKLVWSLAVLMIIFG
jgi:hypothetical protein